MTDFAPAKPLKRNSWVRHSFNGSTARFDYGFDAANRIKYEQRDSGVADGFSFNARNELTGFNQNGTLNANGTVSAAYNLSIAYDANGNRVDASDGGNAHYERAPNNQYSSDWTGALNYDDNANLISRAGWTFTYDAQNRLVKIQSGSTVIQYHYDPLNRIVARRAPNGAITTQVWDDWKLIEEREANGAFRRMYFHGAATNEIVAAYGPAYGDAFYFQDGRGNVTHLTGPGNNVIERYTYFVSGQPNYLSGNSMHNRFLFQGAMFVPEAEIYDMRNRFYHPNLGRFMQSDPIGFDAGDMNLFRYCGNDPVNRTDPDGLVARITPDHFWEGAKHWDSSNTLQGTFAERMDRFENNNTDSNTSTTWRAAGKGRLDEIRKTVAREKTEMSSAMGYDDKAGEYATSSLQRGLGPGYVKDDYNTGRELVQVSDIGRGDLPARFRMIGFVLGHVKYGRQKFMDDMNRARDARMHAIITAPAPDGARNKTPITVYYQYPDPVRTMPPHM